MSPSIQSVGRIRGVELLSDQRGRRGPFGYRGHGSSIPHFGLPVVDLAPSLRDSSLKIEQGLLYGRPMEQPRISPENHGGYDTAPHQP